MKICAIVLAALFSNGAFAEEVFRIEVGKKSASSGTELERRIWGLERAVWQLQQKVFDLENKPSSPISDSWLCTVKAMGNSYTGTGGSKAVAKAKAIEACRVARGGDGFFCNEAECEQ